MRQIGLTKALLRVRDGVDGAWPPLEQRHATLELRASQILRSVRARHRVRKNPIVRARRGNRMRRGDREAGPRGAPPPAAGRRMGGAVRSSLRPTAGVPWSAPMSGGAFTFIGGFLTAHPTWSPRTGHLMARGTPRPSRAAAAAVPLRAERPCGTSPRTNRAGSRARRTRSRRAASGARAADQR